MKLCLVGVTFIGALLVAFLGAITLSTDTVLGTGAGVTAEVVEGTTGFKSALPYLNTVSKLEVSGTGFLLSGLTGAGLVRY